MYISYPVNEKAFERDYKRLGTIIHTGAVLEGIPIYVEYDKERKLIFIGDSENSDEVRILEEENETLKCKNENLRNRLDGEKSITAKYEREIKQLTKEIDSLAKENKLLRLELEDQYVNSFCEICQFRDDCPDYADHPSTAGEYCDYETMREYIETKYDQD